MVNVTTKGGREGPRIRYCNAKCEACGGELRVRVGHKYTVRYVLCGCGVKYEYSCWNLRVLPNGAGWIDKFEAYPVRIRVTPKGGTP
jgi:ssDNA-binding Zn-finger/Zn-ribbon topoisomerase 1